MSPLPSSSSAQPLHAATYATPFGSLAVVVTPEDGVVRGSGFRSVEEVASRVSPRLRGRGWVVAPINHVADAVEAWLHGDGTAITDVRAEQDGGPFFQAVWEAMRAIPSGQPESYADLAAAAGRPRAVRAAGTACARNNLAPFVPCHRVVKSGGALGNYGYGLDVKAAMLTMEASPAASLSSR
ncbi:MAG: cysteine methyltransferase [Actinobacteria bacterium HGW-Actinobacteria-4]|nr:MAG: cysteine methyltransferase [Actinobacteria bacterium HGW-Actinobacteria-4]